MLMLFLKLGRLSVRLICLLFIQIKKTLMLALPGHTKVTKTNSHITKLLRASQVLHPQILVN